MATLFPGLPLFLALSLATSPAAVGKELPIADLAVDLAERTGIPLLVDLDEFSQKKSSQKPPRFGLAYEDQVRQYTALHRGTRLRVVGPVFNEHLHILVRSPLQIHGPADLARLQIWAGPSGGEPEGLGDLYLDHAGLHQVHGSAYPEPQARLLSDISKSFETDKLDVALVPAVPGYQPLCAGMRRGTFTLLPLDYGTLRALAMAPDRRTGIQRPLRIDSIRHGTYFGQDDLVPTLSRSLLLVTRKGTRRALADDRLKKVRAAWERSPQSTHEMGCGSEPDELPEGLAEASDLPWLGGSPPGALRSLAVHAACWILLSGALLTLFALAWKSGLLAEIRSYWARDKLPFLVLLALALSIVAITVGTYLFEKDINEKFSTIPESFWSITIYLFSGLEDRTPYTIPGRVIATLGLLIGPVFFAVMSGWLARFFIRREKKMPQNLRNHYLFLNWNERLKNVVRELHHPILVASEGMTVIVLLTDREDLSLQQLKEAGSGRDEAFEDFFLSIGDPTSERGLLNANAQDARTIVIFADESRGDERTFRSIFALRRIAREHGVTDMHVVAELCDSSNAPILDEMASDFPGLLERISTTELRTYLVAQAAMNPGIVRFYTDLLHTTAETNELYSQVIPDEAAGMEFCDYAACVLQAHLPEPLVPVGIKRIVNGQVCLLTNPPRRDPSSLLRRGDRLLVFAYGPLPPGILPVPETSALAASA